MQHRIIAICSLVEEPQSFLTVDRLIHPEQYKMFNTNTYLRSPLHIALGSRSNALRASAVKLDSYVIVEFVETNKDI